MISNLTKKITIVKKKKYCKSVLSKTIGLMFSKRIDDKGLIFFFNNEKIVPLHMWFVFYPIDVLFLDKDKKVVEIKHNFKPFSFYNPKNNAKYIVELPEGKADDISLSDLIEF